MESNRFAPFRNTRLQTKLILAFLLMVVLVCGAGGSGWFFISGIQDTIRVFTNVTTPLTREAVNLADNIQRTHLQSVEALSRSDEESIRACAEELSRQSTIFQRGVEAFTASAGDADVGLDVERLAEVQKAFALQATAMIEAWSRKLREENLAGRSLETFEKRRQGLGDLLKDLACLSETSMNENEENAKTQLQVGDASVDDLGRILSLTYDRDYPRAQGAFKLQNYLTELQDISRSYLSERNPARLPAIEERFDRCAGRFESRHRRLASRMAVDDQDGGEEKLKTAASSFTALKAGVKDAGGLFETHRESLRASAESTALQSLLSDAYADCNVAVEELVRSVQRLNLQAKEEAQAGVEKALASILSILIVAICTAVLLAALIARGIANPISRLSDLVVTVGNGDLAVEIPSTSRADEVGILTRSVATMVGNLRKTTTSVDALNAQVAVRKQAEDNLRKSAMEQEAAHRKLQDTQARITEQNWKVSGQAELGEQMQGIQDLAALCNNVVTYLAHFLDAQIGALYLSGEDGRLRLVGKYACSRSKNLSSEFGVGEGLIGQAALEKNTILVTNAPDDYIAVRSGLGEATPRNILVAPATYEGKTMGVIELGSFDAFTDRELDFLKQAARSIGITIHSAQSRLQVQDLLEQTQRQAEELEAQQEELRRSNEELEEQASELEQERNQVTEKNDELESARRLIEEKARDLALTSKYKSEFLANMSHELRTPLNSLLLLSRLLTENKDGNLSEKQVEFARTINNSGTELLTLINEILDLSRIEAGKMELFIEEIDVAELLSAVEMQFRPLAEEKGLDFDLRLADDAPTRIRTDRQRLGQILKNLLSNAMKFTSSGSVRVSVTPPAPGTRFARSGLDARQAIAFAVTDTGIGIPSAKRKTIFEAFQQADGTTVRRFGGTGLGLAISRELAGLLGGEIEMESEEGRGSSFVVYLPETAPRAPDRETREEPAGASAPAGCLSEADDAGAGAGAGTAASDGEEETVGAAGKSGGKPAVAHTARDDREEVSPGDRSILIVEDDPDLARMLIDQARERDFKCLVASEGEKALRMADHYKPSGILLDLGLPGMDGLASMGRIKEDLGTRHIPVHVISADEKRSDAMKMGAVGFLRKPVDMEQLDDAFRQTEALITRRVRNLLVVEDDETTCNVVADLVGEDDVAVTIANTAAEAIELLKKMPFDCMVLDLALPDMSGIDLLDRIRKDEDLARLPVVISTGKDLTREEKLILDRYAERVVLKGSNWAERLLDETALFLHRVEKDLPEEKRRMIRMVHDKETIFKGKTILVVDDDMRNVFALSSVLEEKGIRLLIAKNGREGVRCLEDNPNVHLVLMDIMMPEMNGYEAMTRIRGQDRFKALPIIALTAKAMKGDRARCLEAGASDYLAKPVDMEKLLSMLRVWLYQ